VGDKEIDNMIDQNIRVEGSVAAGFESVRDLFATNMGRLIEANSQLCVYVGGVRVVDLWASAVGNEEYSPDNITNVFSSTKNFEAIAMAWLYGQGLFEYGDPVAAYWPEFAGGDKAATTIADVLRHEAGLAAFNHSISTSDLRRDRIKENSIGRVIENHPQAFRKGGGEFRREYHAITRGWIVNEIFRRIDPAKRTIGEFMEGQLAAPLDADVICGVRDSDLNRIVPLTMPGVGFYVRESFKSKGRRRIELNALEGLALGARLMRQMRDRTTRGMPASILDMGDFTNFSKADIAQGEVPSANGHCSARGLAKVAAVMARGGTWQGQEILNEKGCQGLHSEPVKADMGFVTTFTQGGVAYFHPLSDESDSLERSLNEGREGFFGWMGAGGSVFQWHPEYDIGFGYVPTSMAMVDMLNTRGKAYQTEVLRVVR